MRITRKVGQRAVVTKAVQNQDLGRSRDLGRTEVDRVAGNIQGANIVRIVKVGADLGPRTAKNLDLSLKIANLVRAVDVVRMQRARGAGLEVVTRKDKDLKTLAGNVVDQRIHIESVRSLEVQKNHQKEEVVRLGCLR